MVAHSPIHPESWNGTLLEKKPMFHHHLVGTRFLDFWFQAPWSKSNSATCFMFSSQNKNCLPFLYAKADRKFHLMEFHNSILDSSILLKQLDLPPHPITVTKVKVYKKTRCATKKCVFLPSFWWCRSASILGKGGHHLDIQYQYPPVGSIPNSWNSYVGYGWKHPENLLPVVKQQPSFKRRSSLPGIFGICFLFGIPPWYQPAPSASSKKIRSSKNKR